MVLEGCTHNSDLVFIEFINVQPHDSMQSVTYCSAKILLRWTYLSSLIPAEEQDQVASPDTHTELLTVMYNYSSQRK